MKLKTLVLFGCLILTATILIRIHPPAARLALTRRSVPEALSRKIAVQYGKLPLRFEENEGQTGGEVKFLSRGAGYTLFLNSEEAVLSLTRSQAPVPGKQTPPVLDKSAVLRMKLVHANADAKVEGAEKLETRSNYFIGSDQAKWRRNVANFGKVKFSDVYPGVDLVYYGNQQQLEYDFVVSPGADPNAIGLDIAGADQVEINPAGDLVLHASGEQVQLHKPVIYQTKNGSRREIAGGYVQRENHQIGFDVAGYDHSQPLIIDPALSFSLFVGGNGPDFGNAIAIDSAGNAYITGQTHSSNFPVANAAQPFNLPFFDPSTDVFVSKLSASGASLIYSTYLGGATDSATSVGMGIAVDSAGGAYVAGWTTAQDYPVTFPFQSFNQGGATDAVVTRLTPTGDTLVYSTYLGGTGNDEAFAIAVDTGGNAYVTGETDSTTFPITFGPQSFPGGGLDAFVTALTPAGSSLLFSTYLGGSADDFGFGIAVDQTGVYVVGGTNSPSFPVTSGTVQPALQASEDAFVSKLNPSGTALIYSTFLGGLGQDEAHGVAVDSAGNAYITGATSSQNFPISRSPVLQAGLSGPSDAFVTKLNSTGSAILYSTFLGGSSTDVGQGIGVDSSGNAYVAGYTASGSAFPQVSPITGFGGGGIDGFVTMLSPDGSTAVYSSLIGGTGTDQANGIAVSPAGVVYIVGSTDSQNFQTTPGAFRGSGAGSDSFVIKLTAPPIPSPTITVLSPSSTTAGGTSLTLTVTGTNFVLSSVVEWNGSIRPTTFLSNTQLSATLTAADLATAGTNSVNVFSPGATSSLSNTLVFTIVPLIVNNPVPVATSLSPSTTAGGGASFTLTVNGSGFIASSVILWNNSARSTRFVSSSQLTATINASDLTTAGPALVTVSSPTPGGGVSNALTFTITGPVINNNGTVNAASFAPGAGVAAGSIVSVFGSSLSTTTAASTVRLNGTQTFVYDSFGGQINFQVPWELASQSKATLTVTSSSGVTSAPASVNIVPFAPGIFTVNSSGTGQGAILIATSGEIVAPTGSIPGAAARPAKQGEFITIYCTGLGAVDQVIATGQPAPSTPLTHTTTDPTVTIGGSLAPATSGFFSGLAPGFIGLYQVNVQVPVNAPVGDAVPLSISIGGVNSNNVTIAIASAGNPVPTITTLNPASSQVGGASQSVIIVGTNFVQNSSVTFNGSVRSVVFLNSTQMVMALNAADLATAGSFPVAVINPAPGGGISNTVNFTVSP